MQQRFEKKIKNASLKVDVAVKLHLIMPNAEKRTPVSRQITIDNYEEGFTLIRDSAVFEFGVFNIAEECIQQAFVFGMLIIN